MKRSRRGIGRQGERAMKMEETLKEETFDEVLRSFYDALVKALFTIFL